jgi:hypothetical protein
MKRNLQAGAITFALMAASLGALPGCESGERGGGPVSAKQGSPNSLNDNDVVLAVNGMV